MAELRDVLERAVELHAPFVQRSRHFEQSVRADLRAGTGGERGVPVAIGVRFVGEATDELRRTESATGVSTVGVCPRPAKLPEPAIECGTEIECSTLGRVGANAGRSFTLQTSIGRRTAGKDLDDPAERISAVQGRARSAHDLYPFDELKRQILQ